MIEREGKARKGEGKEDKKRATYRHRNRGEREGEIEMDEGRER